MFDLESIYVQEDKIHETDATNWIGKHVPISASISSDMIEETIILSTSNPGALVEPFVDALDGLATQSAAQRNVEFFEINTRLKSELNQYFSALNQGGCRNELVWDFEHGCIDEKGKKKKQKKKKKKKKKKTKKKMKTTKCRYSFYNHKRINVCFCRITWKNIAMFL